MLQEKQSSKKGTKTAKDKYKNLGGEIGRPPFDKDSPVLPLPGRKAKNMPKQKSGGTIKKAQNGALEPSAGRIQSLQQKSADNVKKINMSTAADSMKKNMAGTAKNGKSMKKCKYGCK